MKRLEYKYLVPETALAEWRRQILHYMVPDDHMPGAEGYDIRSIYFDTGDLDYYHQKESGIQHRRKLRIRGYNKLSEDAMAFLEIKRKDNMAISKARAPFYYRDGESLLASGDLDHYLYNPDDDPQITRDGQSFFYHLYRYSLMPTVLVCYRREAFFGRQNPRLRLTLDKTLRSLPFPQLDDLYSEIGQRRSFPGHFILEVKFYGGMPGWIKKILEKYKLERQALSKYCISLEGHGIQQRATTFSVWAQSPKGRRRPRDPYEDNLKWSQAAG